MLTADNSYSGGTTINAGTLQVGNGGATGVGTGPVLDDAALVFNRSGIVTVPGTIARTGSLTRMASTAGHWFCLGGYFFRRHDDYLRDSATRRQRYVGQHHVAQCRKQ